MGTLTSVSVLFVLGCNMEEQKTRVYLCIDLKSFYASVECVERGLDPFTTNLVVADPERTEKTICLAITPAMKALGVKNRCRVFEIPKDLEYIMAVPRMHLYLEYAATVYGVYLRYVAKEDIHVYSVDEAFLDVTDYQQLYGLNAKELGIRIMEDVYRTTGITATCGIGTNLYLAKVALDITAKHAPDHIGVLTEKRYRATMWNHQPLTDFWRIGSGTAEKLAHYGIYTMGQIARTEPDFLYRLFGVDAELLIDHAWGREPVTIADIQAFVPKSSSLSSGQVLPRDYSTEEGLVLVKEMVELLSLDLVDQRLTAESLVLHIGYARACGVPHSHGTARLVYPSNSTKELQGLAEPLYRRIIVPGAPIRRIGVCLGQVAEEGARQYSLFIDPAAADRERSMQEAVISLQWKYGKNAVLRGTSLKEEARTRERNGQIGGHKA